MSANCDAMDQEEMSLEITLLSVSFRTELTHELRHLAALVLLMPVQIVNVLVTLHAPFAVVSH